MKLIEHAMNRFYYWRYPLAHFVDDAHAQGIEIPTAEILSPPKSPEELSWRGQHRQAAALRVKYGVRVLGMAVQDALRAERRRRKEDRAITLAE